jgi:hypothetical protein
MLRLSSVSRTLINESCCALNGSAASNNNRLAKIRLAEKPINRSTGLKKFTVRIILREELLTVGKIRKNIRRQNSM